MDLIEKAKGFLSEPTRETSKEEPLGKAVKYYLFIQGTLRHVFAYMLGIFGWIWAGVLNVVGLHQYQDLPEGKSKASVLIQVILLLILSTTGF